MEKKELTKEERKYMIEIKNRLEEDVRMYSKLYCLANVITPKQFKEHYGYE